MKKTILPRVPQIMWTKDTKNGSRLEPEIKKHDKKLLTKSVKSMRLVPNLEISTMS